MHHPRLHITWKTFLAKAVFSCVFFATPASLYATEFTDGAPVQELEPSGEPNFTSADFTNVIYGDRITFEQRTSIRFDGEGAQRDPSDHFIRPTCEPFRTGVLDLAKYKGKKLRLNVDRMAFRYAEAETFNQRQGGNTDCHYEEPGNDPTPRDPDGRKGPGRRDFEKLRKVCQSRKVYWGFEYPELKPMNPNQEEPLGLKREALAKLFKEGKFLTQIALRLTTAGSYVLPEIALQDGITVEFTPTTQVKEDRKAATIGMALWGIKSDGVGYDDQPNPCKMKSTQDITVLNAIEESFSFSVVENKN